MKKMQTQISSILNNELLVSKHWLKWSEVKSEVAKSCLAFVTPWTIAHRSSSGILELTGGLPFLLRDLQQDRTWVFHIQERFPLTSDAGSQTLVSKLNYAASIVGLKY